MRKFFARIMGSTLMAVAVIGILISIAAIVGVWSVKDEVQAGLQGALNVMDHTLQVTADGLNIADTSLQQAGSAVDTLVTTVQNTGTSLQNVLPLLDTVTRITTVDLPGSVIATQVALSAAQTSAQIIDNTMQFLSTIPLLGIKPPAVESPLSTAIGEVSKSLDPMPASLTSMESSLTTASENVTTFEGKFNQMAGDIEKIGASIDTAKGVVNQYQGVVADLQQKTDAAIRRLPGTLTLLAWLFTFLMAWMALTQVGLLLQGWDMMGFKRKIAAKIEEEDQEPTP